MYHTNTNICCLHALKFHQFCVLLIYFSFFFLIDADNYIEPIVRDNVFLLLFKFSVLGTLVKNKLVPDPFYGLNNEAIIDIADSGREYYTFWFFTSFEYALVWHIVQCTLF